MSRIGKQPIHLPDGVKFSQENGLVSIVGPKGNLLLEPHPDIIVKDENGNIVNSGDRTGRVFYDSYAFRRVNHPKPHPSAEINRLVYNRGEPFVKVSSCFGGLAIYRRDASTRKGGLSTSAR